jgi:hypothetical protein
VYDENDALPSEAMVMDWNEHNDHADGAGPDPDFDEVPEPAATTWPYATPDESDGAYTINMAPAWRNAPLRPVLHRVPVDEDQIMTGWAARLCWLEDPRASTVEPKAPRMHSSMDLAVPSTGYAYPLILRFTDPDAAEAMAAHLSALAAELRAAAPDPFNGCVDCVRSAFEPCPLHQTKAEDGPR